MAEETIPSRITKSVIIKAPIREVWAALTVPGSMKQWMSPGTDIEIMTSWEAGSPFIIRGPWYKKSFENKGIVLSFEPRHTLSYSHLSSLSRLPDVPANYTSISFTLYPADDATTLELALSHFPTGAIYHHFNFYWNVSLQLLKKFAESPG